MRTTLPPENRRQARAIERRRTRRRRILRRAGAVLAVAAVAVVVGLVIYEPPPPSIDREASVVLREQGEPMEFGQPPRSYRAVYRIDDVAGDTRVITTDRVLVRRPFQAVVEAWEGEPPGAERTFAQRTAFSVFETTSANAEPAVFTAQPGLAASDLRPGAGLNEAAERGLVQVRERREVLGRECQVYRAGGPLAGGTITPYDPEGTEWADGCFDADGFMVEEVWALDGDPVRRRLLVEADLSPDVDDDSFIDPGTEPTAGLGDGSASVLRLEPDSRAPGDEFLEVGTVPEGFEHFGRFAVVWPHSEDRTAQERPRVGTIVDVYTDGADALFVERGGSADGSPVFQADDALPDVDVGQLGTADLILGLRTVELRIPGEGGRFVRVSGTLGVEPLAEVARGLEPVEGGELRYVDPPPGEVDELVEEGTEAQPAA